LALPTWLNVPVRAIQALWLRAARVRLSSTRSCGQPTLARHRLVAVTMSACSCCVVGAAAWAGDATATAPSRAAGRRARVARRRAIDERMGCLSGEVARRCARVAGPIDGRAVGVIACSGWLRCRMVDRPDRVPS